MTNRKQIELDRFKENINRVWSLSVIEDEVLNSFLTLFLAGETNKLSKIESLIENDYIELLNFIPDYSIEDFAEKELKMIKEHNQKTIDDFKDNELLQECLERDLALENDTNLDIVTSSNLDEMTSLFLSFSCAKQMDIINNLKQL